MNVIALDNGKLLWLMRPQREVRPQFIARERLLLMHSLFQIVNERCPEFEPGKFFRVTLVFNKMLQLYVMESFVVPGEEKAPRLKTRINAGCQLLDVPMAQLHEVGIAWRTSSIDPYLFSTRCN